MCNNYTDTSVCKWDSITCINGLIQLLIIFYAEMRYINFFTTSNSDDITSYVIFTTNVCMKIVIFCQISFWFHNDFKQHHFVLMSIILTWISTEKLFTTVKCLHSCPITDFFSVGWHTLIDSLKEICNKEIVLHNSF